MVNRCLLKCFLQKIKEPPSKYVTMNVDVQLACRLLFVDLEGLSDGRAVKTIIPQVNPRKMVRCLQTNIYMRSSPSIVDPCLGI